MFYSRKTRWPHFIILLFLSALLSCSSDDKEDLYDEVYLSANINGNDYLLNGKTATITARRFIGQTGLLKFEVMAVALNGEWVSFQIPDYKGPDGYIIGENPMLPTLIAYGDQSSVGQWSCNNPGPNELEQNFIEIINDDGIFIAGNFQFTGQNIDDESLQKISNGKFRLLVE
ncbi:hypothetical protein E0K83_14905 [Gramella sp. BOM4]|nr:hypothetical protein [Christiangramia bathymodioli]